VVIEEASPPLISSPVKRGRVGRGRASLEVVANFRSGIGETTYVAFPLLYPPPQAGEEKI